jgi:hypothetical protein
MQMCICVYIYTEGDMVNRERKRDREEGREGGRGGGREGGREEGRRRGREGEKDRFSRSLS